MSFFLQGLRIFINGIEVSEYQAKEYKMSQIGKPIKKVTVEPEAVPVPPKTAPVPTPVEEPVKTPA